MIKARRHYTISLNQQAPKHNRRALYGLFYTCNSIIHYLLNNIQPSSSSSSSNNANITTNAVDYIAEKEMTMAFIEYCNIHMKTYPLFA